jgi:hypothetical protein
MSLDLGDHSLTFDLPVLDFIDFFAKKNTARHFTMWTTDCLLKIGYPVGNSRDPPTTFTRACENHDLGCTFISPSAIALDHHQQVICVYRPSALEATIYARQLPKVFKCTECTGEFWRRKNLQQHQKFIHGKGTPVNDSWQHKSCDLGCDTGYVYTTERRYKDHVSKFHGGSSRWPPQQCAPRSTCKNNMVF